MSIHWPLPDMPPVFKIAGVTTYLSAGRALVNLWNSWSLAVAAGFTSAHPMVATCVASTHGLAFCVNRGWATVETAEEGYKLFTITEAGIEACRSGFIDDAWSAGEWIDTPVFTDPLLLNAD